MRCEACGRFLTELRGWDGTDSFIGYVCGNEACDREGQPVEDPARDWEYFGYTAEHIEAMAAEAGPELDFIVNHIRAERQQYLDAMAKRRRGMVAHVRTIHRGGWRVVHILEV